MDDAPEGTQDETATEPASETSSWGRPPAWPDPPPQTVEHAVALLATTWSRAGGAA